MVIVRREDAFDIPVERPPRPGLPRPQHIGKIAKGSRSMMTCSRWGTACKAAARATASRAVAISAREGSIRRIRIACAPIPSVSRSSAENTLRWVPFKRMRIQASSHSSATLITKITQPSKKWVKPSRWPTPHCRTTTPAMAMRTEFISTVIGAAASNRIARCQTGPR